MKLYNKLIIITIVTIAFYATLLIISDISSVYTKISKFKLDYLPLILTLIPLSWLTVFIRWHLLLKNLKISVPIKDNFKICLAGFALSITPGKVGELIKSQLLKSRFGISREKTAPLVLMEQFYNMLGLVIVSVLGIWYFEFSAYVMTIVSVLLFIVFVLISSNKIYFNCINKVSKIKFLFPYIKGLTNSHTIIIRSMRGKIFVIASLLSITFWFIESTIVYFVLLSFDIKQFEFFKIVTIYATSIILGVASFLPLGIGVVEGSLTSFLTIQGIEVSISLTLVVFIRIFTRWIAVSLGFIFLKTAGGYSLKN